MNTSNSKNSAYGPAHKPLVGSWIVPDRWSLFFFRYHWSHIRSAIILIIMTLALYPAIGPAVIGVDLIYLVWNSFVSEKQLDQKYTRLINFIRHLVPILFVFISILVFGKAVEPLWLLFFVPMLTVGVEIDRLLAVVIIGINAALVFIISLLLSSPSSTTFTLSIDSAMSGDFFYSGMKAIMISYTGFTSYFLSRSLAYVHQLNKRLLHLLPGIVPEPYGWDDAAKEVVDRVSVSFSDWQETITVNVLTLYGDELHFTASSSYYGQSLVKEDFSFPQKLGITGYVAQTGQTMFINDVSNDPEHLYYAHPSFPGIKAELAVAVKVAGKVVAVLDMESRRINAFGNEDQQAMELISAHLAEIYKQTHLLGKYQKLVQMGTNHR